MPGIRIHHVAVVVLSIAVAGVLSAPRALADDRWTSPVDGPVVDPFRPPTHAYGAGNRGLEYGVAAGTPVHAVDGGVVRWSGVVAGRAYVSIDHGGGLWSTYGPLDERSVLRGQRVGRGVALGTAADGFHLTARVDGIYVDPQLLLDGATVQVALVDGVAPPSGAPGLGRPAPPLESPFVAALRQMDPWRRGRELLASIDDWHHTECTGDAVAVPTGRGSGRVLVQVAGVTTSSERSTLAHLDTDRLGYDAVDVVAFSYAGGAAPIPFGSAASAPAVISSGLAADLGGGTPYRPDDTVGDIHLAAERLADLVDAIVDERPGQPVDIAAHSLGGVVTRLALEILSERHGGSPPVSVVVTMGSPHRVPGLAIGAEALAGGELPDLAGRVGVEVDGLELVDTPVVAQLAGLDVDVDGRVAAPPPDGVRTLAIASANDTVVLAPEARWSGATNVIVSGAGGAGHTEVVASEATHRAIELHLAGAPPACRSIVEVAAAATAGQVAVATTGWLAAHLAALDRLVGDDPTSGSTG